jgi:hypothetical protein
MPAQLILNVGRRLGGPAGTPVPHPDKVTQGQVAHSRIAPLGPRRSACRRAAGLALTTASARGAALAGAGRTRFTEGRLQAFARQPAPRQGADEWEQF